MGLKDDMWRLEAKGHESDVKKPTGSNIMFVRGDEQSKAVQEMQSTENPDEIDISEDEDEDEKMESRPRRKRRWRWRKWMCRTRCLEDSRNPVRRRWRAAQEEREGGGGGDGCAGQGVWRTQETQCGEDGEPPKKKEKVAVEEMDVPDKVFGGLKKP